MTVMKRAGMSIIEVLVAMAILAIVGASLVGVLPLLTRSTQAATTGSTESQSLYAVFEHVASEWSNITAWNNEEVSVPDGSGGFVAQAIATYVVNQVGATCTTTVTEVEPGVRKRLVINCPADGNRPAREMRSEYGNPNV